MSGQKRLVAAGAVAVVLIATISLVMFWPDSTPPENKPLRCAFDTWLGYSAFYLADEMGYFEEQGLDVELKVINPLQEKNAAMIRGDIDCMGGSIDSSIISSTSGVPGKIIFVFESSRGNDTLLAEKSITSADGLRGKKIGVEVGYVSHLFLLRYLQQNNMTPSDVNIVDVSNEQGTAAFVAGSLDAFSTWEPFTTQAQKREDGAILATSKGMKELFCGTLYASQPVIDAHPEDLRKLVAALQKANTYWLQNPAEGNAIVAKRWEMSVEEVEAIMVNTTLFTAGDQQRMFGTSNEPGELVELLEICKSLWQASGEVKEDVEVKTLMDDKFVAPLIEQKSEAPANKTAA